MAENSKNEILNELLGPTNSSQEIVSNLLSGQHNLLLNQPSSFLDSVAQTLDYAGNISRTGIKSALSEDGEFLKDVGEAIQSKKRTSERDLINTIFPNAPKFGKDDGEFQMGDIADIAIDTGVGIATDPLTWLSGGLSAGLKKGSASTSKLADLATKAGLPSDTAKKAIEKASRAEKLAPPILGATYGAGATDSEATNAERLAAAAVGAGVGYSAPKYIGPKIKEALYGTKDKDGAFKTISNLYGKRTEQKLADLDEVYTLAQSASDKAKRITRELRDDYAGAIENLSKTEKNQFFDIISELKDSTTSKRNRIYKKLLKTNKIPQGESQRNFQLWNLATRQATKLVDPDYQKALTSHDENLTKSLEKWTKASEKMRLSYNKNNADKGFPEEFIGLKYWAPYVYKKKQLKGTPSSPDLGFKQAKKARSDEILQDLDLALDVWTQQTSRKFLDREQRSALEKIAKYQEDPNKILKSYDRLHSFIKTNLLFASTTWLKNTFWDNAAKSYIENGLTGLIKHTDLDSLTSGLTSDIANVTKGKYGSYKNPDVKDALARGVIADNIGLKSLNEQTLPYLYDPEQIEKLATKQSTNTLDTYAKKYEAFWQNSVGNFGSALENQARMNQYLRTIKALKTSNLFKETTEKLGIEKADNIVRDIAAKNVTDTFYDYADVRHFEKAVMQRLFSFYSFYSKNLPYFFNALLDADKASRVANIKRTIDNIGEEPDIQEEDSLPTYIQKNNPRRTSVSSKGTMYSIAPNFSADDAMQMAIPTPSNIGNQAIEKLSPIIKTAMEIGSGHDFFTDKPLNPSDLPGQSKGLYSKGYKWQYIQDLMGLNLGMELKNGRPRTTSDTLAKASKIANIMSPPILDQVVGSIGKANEGIQPISQSAANTLFPIQQINVSPETRRFLSK